MILLWEKSSHVTNYFLICKSKLFSHIILNSFIVSICISIYGIFHNDNFIPVLFAIKPVPCFLSAGKHVRIVVFQHESKIISYKKFQINSQRSVVRMGYSNRHTHFLRHFKWQVTSLF